jgi:hypothetical protein
VYCWTDASPDHTVYWTPSLTSVEVQGNTVTVSFQSAPADFNFLSYEVAMIYVQPSTLLNDRPYGAVVNCSEQVSIFQGDRVVFNARAIA